MTNETDINSTDVQKNQTFLKIGIGAAILTIFVIYRVYIAFSSVDENSIETKEEVTIFKNDDLVQTKFAHEITPEIKAQRSTLDAVQKQIKEQQEMIEFLKQQNKEIEKKRESDTIEIQNQTNPLQQFGFPQPLNSNTQMQNNQPKRVIVQPREDSFIFEVEKKSSNETEENETQNRLILPPGAVIKARLVSGVRAPTLSRAAQEPEPVVLKVTDLAMLPNFATMNIKECAIKGEAKGNLSTETVQIRTNFLSCVTDDGKVLVNKLFGTVIGGNGSNGIAGTVVSKQGALLGRSLIAGFVDGFASIANNQYQDTLTSTTGTLTTTQDLKGSDLAKSGAYGGIANAGKEMSKFYMDMVKNIEPSIEVKPNIEVDVIITDISYIDLNQIEEKKQ